MCRTHGLPSDVGFSRSVPAAPGIPSRTHPSAAWELPGASRRCFPSIPGTEAVWENGPRAACKPTIRSGAGPLWKRRAPSFGRDRAATQPELSCPFVRGDVWVWGFVIVVGGGCRFGFLGSMSLDFDGKKLAFHESLSLII